jgi:hypothetical protein
MDHVMTFHLWCSCNSLNHDSIWLGLFQRTLTRVTMKWYIELERSSHLTFGDLSMVFLNHFQLLVQYDIETDILVNFEQNNATHISIIFKNGGYERD